MASLRKGCTRGRSVEAPFGEDFFEGAVGLQFSEASVDLLQQVRVGFADADADGAGDGGLVGLDDADAGELALGEVVGEDGGVEDGGLDAGGVHVGEDVGEVLVELHLCEEAGFLEYVDVGGADLDTDGHALHVFEGDVVLGVGGGNDEAFAVGVDGVRKVDDLLARWGDVHRGGDDIDLVAGEGGDEGGELHAFDGDLEVGDAGDGVHEVYHHALDGVRFCVEEGERAAGGGGADFQDGLGLGGAAGEGCGDRQEGWQRQERSTVHGHDLRSGVQAACLADCHSDCRYKQPAIILGAGSSA